MGARHRVQSDAGLPELERFRVDGVFDDPTIVSLGEVASPRKNDKPSRIRYREWGRVGFFARSTTSATAVRDRRLGGG